MRLRPAQLCVSPCSARRLDGLHQLVGDDGDKEVTVGPLRGLVEDGTQAEFGFERTKHSLHVGEGAVGAPQGLLVPVPDVGVQAVDAGMGDKGAFERPAFPGDGAGLVAIAFDLNSVVRANAVALFLDTPDALPDVVEPLAGARTRQAVAEFLELACTGSRDIGVSFRPQSLGNGQDFLSGPVSDHGVQHSLIIFLPKHFS